MVVAYLCLTVLGHAFGLTGVAVGQQPSQSQLIQSLRNYRTAFHGMTYLTSTDFTRRRGDRMQVWVSRDGRIVKTESKSHSSHGVISESGSFAIDRKGMYFRASQRTNRPSVGMTMTLYPPNTMAAVCVNRDVSTGSIEHLRYTQYVGESKTLISSVDRDGAQYWQLDCDHPKLYSVKFIFDENLVLRYLETFGQEGDQIDATAIHDSPRHLTRGQWIQSLTGPIEYQKIDHRMVPAAIPYRGKCSEGPTGDGVRYFSDFAFLNEDLDESLSFSNLALPDATLGNGSPRDDSYRVTSQGEEGIRYELRDAEIVKIIDSNAANAAAAARWRTGSTRRSWIWYGGCALFFLAGILVIVWLRFGGS